MEEWACWRIIACDPPLASLTELETTWSLDDLLRANAVLDHRLYVQNKAMKAATGGKG